MSQRYRREMTPVFETNFKPVKVTAEVCREACRKISDPEHGVYFQELFRQFYDNFQINNKQLSIDIDSRPSGDVNVIIENVDVPTEKLPSLAYNCPQGVKLIDQRFDPAGQRMTITFCYRCVKARRDRSPRRSSSSSPSPSPPRRHRSRRPQTPSPPPARQWSLFGN